MGAGDAETNSGFIEAVDEQSENAGRAGSASTTDSATDSGRTADGRTAEGRTTEAEKARSAVVSVLTDEQERERKRAERNEKRRARYAQQKAENGQSVKPRKVNGTKKSTTPTVDSTQIGMILTTVSGIVASRPNMAHWQLTPTEVQQLATPICNMMAKSEALSQLGEHADAVALVTAVFTIALPRVIITMSMTKTGKEKTKNVAGIKGDSRTVRKSETTENRKDSTSDNRSNETSAVDGASDGVADGYIGEPL